MLSVLDKVSMQTIPDLLRIPDGILSKLDTARVKALGNAVVPECAEIVGRAILNKRTILL
jgi:site-specific DNA-cytosine methylase